MKASSYAGGATPKSMIIEMSSESRGIHYHSETAPATGETFHVDYTARYDGRPAIVTGDRGVLLPVSLTRVDANHVRASYTNGFQVTAVSERVVSQDGSTLTVTTTSEDAQGQKHINVGVYHRIR